jgi:uncharacterized protein YjiS (DUF1127 family)
LGAILRIVIERSDAMSAANFLSLPKFLPLPRRSRTAARFAGTADLPGRVAAWLGACLERSRQRRRLADLDDGLLKDIGLSRADVARECGRWPWDGAPTARLSGANFGPIRRPSERWSRGDCRA